MASDVNVLVRGQSNAERFVDYGGAARLEQRLEAALNNVDIHIVESHSNQVNSIYSGSAFLNWDTDGKQQDLVSFIKGQTADIRDNPTITLWIHNEFDGETPGVSTGQWVSEVRADAALVRSAFEQGADTTPYVFTYVPFPTFQDGSLQAIQNGMWQLSSDGTFNARFDSNAMNGIAMDGDGYNNSRHMGSSDALRVADQLMPGMIETVSGLANVAAMPTAGDSIVSVPQSETPVIAEVVDWDTIAAQVIANFNATGIWYY
ncbi:hypothetical protein ACFQY5_37260 [Paeniroseomonas aquatica]|jgi:hypothetical protein|uniref:Calcium-binding protein n=1 Tax=Paeniroseomonas aquatica TaxID=373043 RepID=A0ABT8A8S6_9PROT|nr:hypothetical protein [Paeniroseomonas aquatica]MDN3566036.1 hypothetical protein [Paeniroseomonas aquatica]